MASLAQKARITRQITLFSYAALMAVFTLWYLWLHPLKLNHDWVIWLVHVLPLACFIPTLKSGNPRGHAWLCFVLLLYFNEAVLATTTREDTRIFGLIYTIQVMVLFTAAMMYARWGSQHARSQSAQ